MVDLARRTVQPSCRPLNAVVRAELQARIGSFDASATLVAVDGRVVLEEVSPTYGKQMAQEIARKADLVVVANRIRVLGTSTATRPPYSRS